MNDNFTLNVNQSTPRCNKASPNISYWPPCYNIVIDVMYVYTNKSDKH